MNFLVKDKFKRIVLYLCLITFLLYGYFIYLDNSFFSNLSSFANGALCFLFVFINIKFINYPMKKMYQIILLYTVFWTFGDLIWFLYENFMPEREYLSTLSEVFYIFASFSIWLIAVSYIFINIRNIDKKKLIVDFFATSFCVYYIIKAFIRLLFTDVPFSLANVNTGTASLFFDILLVVTLILIVSTFKIKKIKKSMVVNIISIVIFTVIDIIYIYKFIISNYETNDFLDLLYALPIVLFCFGLILEQNEYIYDLTIEVKGDKVINSEIKLKNVGNYYIITTIFLILLLTDLTLYKLNKISVNDALNILILMVLYLVINMYYQNSLKNKSIINYHMKVNEELESKVYERTKELEKTNERLLNLINTDFLTYLGSRKYLINTLELFFNSNVKDIVLIVVDFLQFKNVNYISGYKAGDDILKETAKRLKDMFPNEQIFRTDSNEFAVLFKNTNYDVKKIELIARKISANLKTFELENNKKINLNIAIGSAKWVLSEDLNLPDLLKNAEYACKEVKTNYNDDFNYKIFDDELEQRVNRTASIDSLLRSINFDDELTMVFQPQFTTDGKKLIGMESLIRWNSPILGFVSPAEFIPIAEENNTIIKIVNWTLLKSIKQVKYWNEKYNLDLKIGINISPKCIDSEEFLSKVKEFIENNKIEPSWLDFEMTEMSVMNVGESVTKLFEQLHDMNITISIDDFGTGYSSLSYLKSFKIDKLKIAKELIDNITSDVNESMVVNSIINMAKGLGLKTIAEGVEYIEQRDALQQLNCDQIQGYFYGKPVNFEEFEEKHLKNIIV